VFRVPLNFQVTVLPYNPQNPRRQAKPPQIHINPQTSLICEMLGVTNPFSIFCGRQPYFGALGGAADDGNTNDSLDVDDRDEGILDDSDFVNSTLDSSTSFVTANSTFNPDEISLDDLDNDDDDDEDDAAAVTTDSCEPPAKRQSFSPPVASHSQSTSETELPTDNSDDIVSDAVKADSPPDNKPTSSSTPAAIQPGALKRRNFAIYSNADNNSSNDSD